MFTRLRHLLVLGLLAGGGLVAAQPLGAQAESTTLYQRLGGYDVIATIVDDFFGRFGTDPQLTSFLGGINAPAGARIRQNFVDFFCSRTGGPCLYNGRDMTATHEGLGITDAHFDAVIRHFTEAIDKANVRQRERDEILALLRPLRAEIVQP